MDSNYGGGAYDQANQMADSMALNERYPINTNQPINYNSNDYAEMGVESQVNMTNGIAVTKLNGPNETPDICEPPNLAYYAKIWKYLEQIKSIGAGLLLLSCSGLHTVWAIFQVLYFDTSEKYRHNWQQIGASNNTNETNRVSALLSHIAFDDLMGLLFTVIIWYIGAMIGSFLAGWYLLPSVQKKNIYYIAALMMFLSICLFYGASVAELDWQAQFLFGRFFAGISHGITYVTIFVHASENASKDFRHILLTIIGITIALSICFTSTFLIYVPIPELDDDQHIVKDSEVSSANTIMVTSLVFCLASVAVNYFFSHETVPFLLKHNYRDDEALYVLSKLHDEDSNSAIVHSELEAMKEMCNNDYIEFQEQKIFRSIHRNLLSFALYGRLVAVQSFNVPIVVFFVKVLRAVAANDFVEELEKVKGNETFVDTMKHMEHLENEVNLYLNAVKTTLMTWFVFGVAVTLIANLFKWKRGIHLTSFLAGAIVIVFNVLYITGIWAKFFAGITLLTLFIYFNCLSIIVDIIGYTYLTECFPVSTKPWAIGFVSIIENLFQILIISADLRPDSYILLEGRIDPELIGMGLLLALLGYRLYHTAPETRGLSLAAAKMAFLQATNAMKWWHP